MLYFGYSLRDELRLRCPRDSIGARAGMVRFNEAHDKGDMVMKKFLLGTVGLLALGMAAPASAADLAPVRTRQRRSLRRPDLRLDRLLHRRQWRLGPEPQLCGFP